MQLVPVSASLCLNEMEKVACYLFRDLFVPCILVIVFACTAAIVPFHIPWYSYIVTHPFRKCVIGKNKVLKATYFLLVSPSHWLFTIVLLSLYARRVISDRFTFAEIIYT